MKSTDQPREPISEGHAKEWEPMKLTYEGDGREVIQGGGGKASITPSDPGETRKPKPK